MAFDDNQNNDNNNNQDTGAADQTAQQAQQQNAADDHTKVFLVAGERAFKSPDDAVAHIEHAQTHISTLEAERAADRERIEAQEAELQRLRNLEAGLQGRENNSGNAAQTEQPSKEDIAKHAADLALGIIKNNQSEAVKTANLVEAEKAAAAAYGDGYKAKVVEMATKVGMSPAQVDALGKDSPEAFKRLFVPAEPGQPHTPSQGSVNVDDLNGGQQKPAPRNILKMRSEKDRITEVSARMKAAGVAGYN